ncbi:MAG: hypothetical protein N2483_10105 [Burkholderiaceae bacterium]|nr:hypothetical protein [Burkholderiaceae bacterium]
MKSATKFGIVILGATLFSGCASTYSNLVSGHQLGVMEYRPAVYVPPGKEPVYEQKLQLCRQAAANRQLTSAHEAQLGTITNSVRGAVGGAATGAIVGRTWKDIGLDVSVNRSAGIGAAAGLASSLAGSFASGAQRTAAESRAALLTCLRSFEAEHGFRVLE